MLRASPLIVSLVLVGALLIQGCASDEASFDSQRINEKSGVFYLVAPAVPIIATTLTIWAGYELVRRIGPDNEMAVYRYTAPTTAPQGTKGGFTSEAAAIRQAEEYLAYSRYSVKLGAALGIDPRKGPFDIRRFHRNIAGYGERLDPKRLDYVVCSLTIAQKVIARECYRNGLPNIVTTIAARIFRNDNRNNERLHGACLCVPSDEP